MDSEALSFSVVVPTYDRPEDLRRCLRSVGAQTRVPHQVVVVVDGDRPGRATAEFDDLLDQSTALTVTTSDGPTGLSVARNTGIREATGSVVVFLDDDVVLGETYLERLARLYELFDDERLAGVGGFDELATQSRLGRLYDRLFYQAPPGWRVNRAGMAGTAPPVRYARDGENRERDDPARPTDVPWRADWLVGNNMSFKREVVAANPFPQWNGGREVHEDLAVGWKLERAGYHCLVDPRLPLEHREVRGDPDVTPFVRSGRNRVRLFRRHGDPEDWPLFVLAASGEVQKELLAGLATGDVRDHWTRAAGLLAGTVAEAVAPGPDPAFGPLADVHPEDRDGDARRGSPDPTPQP